LGFEARIWLADPRLAFWIVILAGIWITTPFFTIVLFAGLQSLPSAVFEAAKVDGASEWQTFLHVTVPLLFPVISLSLILMILEALRVYDIVYLLTFGGPGRATEVLSIYAYKESFQFFHMGYGTSISNITSFIGVLIGIMLLQIIRKTITNR
jgi:multiple sugar transport system permease protein